MNVCSLWYFVAVGKIVVLNSLLGGWTQLLHGQRHKSAARNNICQPVYISMWGFGRFLYLYSMH